jgi:hypothetical protein
MARPEPPRLMGCSPPYRRRGAGIERGRTNLTIDCAVVRERGWEYVDAELDAEELDGIGRHVVLCVACRHAVAFDRAFLELLRRQRAAPAPGQLTWRVKVSLRAVQA